MIPPQTAALIAAGAIGAFVAFEVFRKTRHGSNPWTFEGFMGVLHIMPHVMRVASETGADWNSVFRSPVIQRAIYDAKRKDPAQWAVVVASAAKAGKTVEQYVEFLATAGRHLRGLAGDFSKKSTTTDILSRQIFELAKAGKIGPVKKVLDERDHAHVEWYGPGEIVKPPVLEAV